MKLNLEEAIQLRPCAGDHSEGVYAGCRARAGVGKVGVVHHVESVSAELEIQRVLPDIDTEVLGHADVSLPIIRAAEAIDVVRQDARHVRAGLGAHSLVPTLGAGLAERYHGVAWAGLRGGQHAARGVEPVAEGGIFDHEAIQIAVKEAVGQLEQGAPLPLVTARKCPATDKG